MVRRCPRGHRYQHALAFKGPWRLGESALAHRAMAGIARPMKAPQLPDSPAGWRNYRFTMSNRSKIISAERHANALVLAPYNIAGIDFLLWKDDECELIRYPALRSDFERGSRVGDITNNAADRYVADPDQTHVKNRPTPS